MSDHRAQIDSAKIRVGGGIAGAIFTVGSMLIFLLGIPKLWCLFPAAIVLGGAVALILRFARHENPGTPWILPAASEAAPEKPKSPERPQGPARALVGHPAVC